MNLVLLTFALAISAIGIVVFAYAGISTETQRASKARTKQLQKKIAELGYKGTINITISEGSIYSKGAFGGVSQGSYKPHKDDPKQPINFGMLDNMPLPIFWRTQNLVIIGSAFSLIGLILGALSQIV